VENNVNALNNTYIVTVYIADKIIAGKPTDSKQRRGEL
jgi:hypothetical protein